MKLVDVHAHLECSRFEEDLKEVLERFRKFGGVAVINSGVNPETNRKILEMSKKYDLIKPSFGIYPIDALAALLSVPQKFELGGKVKSGEGCTQGLPSKEGNFLREVKPFDLDEELGWIEDNKDFCVAIGEVSLDYNWPDFIEHKEKQIETFEKIIVLAKKLNKTLVVHSRKAELDAVELLEKHEAKKVVMHCFNGRKSLIKRGIENGWFFSVPPIITRLQHFQMLAGLVPLEQLLTETDSPYLSPEQGLRNEPANVAVTIREISKIKCLGEEEVSERIFNNAKCLFSL